MAPRGVRVLPTEGRECIEDTVNVALKEFDKNHPPKISRHFIPRNDTMFLIVISKESIFNGRLPVPR